MIHFVGAGPGDPGLITVRGKELLTEADIVIYAGSLVPKELLGYCKKGAIIYNSAHMTLDEVIEVIVEGSRKGKEVVRLHTGDPSIYGAIREQIDMLKDREETFEVVPGVSSFSAAAAALNMEYTLPGVSQSIIITRMEGRTGVPEGERLIELAKHGASMAIFLSAAMTRQVSKALLDSAAYFEDSPAAIVYKVTHKDEKIIRCTVGTLDSEAEREGISKTALILVGDFLKEDKESYEKSRLYAEDFTTGCRRGSDQRIIRCISFTGQGRRVGEVLAASLEEEVLFTPFEKGMELDAWTKDAFDRSSALIFIGAAGIAVRAVSSYIKSKATDPAVIVIDDGGRKVIPLLSGHIGGGNALANRLAGILGAEAVITTSTDINEVFAIDEWAVRNGMKVENPQRIKEISSKLLRKEKVRVWSRFCIEGEAPENVEISDDKNTDVIIDINTAKNDTALHLVPEAVVIGIGCRKDTEAEKIGEAFESFCSEKGICQSAVKKIATIDLKKDEPGIAWLCSKLCVSLTPYSSGELNDISGFEGEFASSPFVESVTGTGNVCERSAVKAAGAGKLLAQKSVYDGVTLAAAVIPLTFKWS